MADPATIATLGVLSASLLGIATILGREREEKVIIKEKDYVALDYGDKVEVFPIQSQESSLNPTLTNDHVELKYDATDGQVTARFYL